MTLLGGAKQAAGVVSVVSYFIVITEKGLATPSYILSRVYIIYGDNCLPSTRHA